MSIAERVAADTARAIVDKDGRVVVILAGADAADAAAEYAEAGYRVVLLDPEF